MECVPVFHKGQPVGPGFDRGIWKSLRQPRNGSSDSPAILGIDPDRAPWDVWDRIVLGDWKDGAEGGDIRRGNRQEPVARQVFRERTGLKCDEITMLHHESDPMIVTDLDGIIERPNEWPREIRDNELWSAVVNATGPGALEIKVPRIKGFYEIKSVGLSRTRVVQFQHHLAVTGFEWGFYMVFTPEYDDCILFPFVRNDRFCRGLIQIIKKWRAAHVATKQRPTRPVPAPPKWPDPVPGEATFREDPEWLGAAQRVVETYYAAKAATAASEAAEEALAALVGPEDRHLSGGGVVVKRKSSTPQIRKDAGAYKAAVALLKLEGRKEEAEALKPEDFVFKTKSSELVDIKVIVGPPAGVDWEGA